MQKFDKLRGVAAPLNILNIDIVNYRRLEKIVDLLGKEAKQKANQLLLYIYDDGTVVKKIIHK